MTYHLSKTYPRPLNHTENCDKNQNIFNYFIRDVKCRNFGESSISLDLDFAVNIKANLT